MRDMEKVKRARELHARGYTTRQIADRIDTTFTTARRYFDPEYDKKMSANERERKKRYRGTCEVCGRSTSHSGKNGLPSQRCRSCAAKERKIWTQERVIAAIQKWAEEHGRPPSSVDWNNSLAKVPRGPEYPSATAVCGKDHGVFPKWADAIEAAGFPRPKPLYGGEHGVAFWTKERIIKALRRHSVRGVAPSAGAWKCSGDDHPTAGWVRRIFGSWTKACHEAGLVTHQEAYWHGPPDADLLREIDAILDEVLPSLSVDPHEIEAARLAFVHRVMDDHVLRRFVVRQLWEIWGFESERRMATWLSKNDVEEFPGYSFQPRRQLTREELEEARALALPPAVT